MIRGWQISIRLMCFCVSRFVACDRNYDRRQRKTQLWRRLLTRSRVCAKRRKRKKNDDRVSRLYCYTTRFHPQKEIYQNQQIITWRHCHRAQRLQKQPSKSARTQKVYRSWVRLWLASSPPLVTTFLVTWPVLSVPGSALCHSVHCFLSAL